MKQFLKMTLATICGIAIFLTVTGIFMMISLVGMLASESASTSVKSNSVFVIALRGTINERTEEASPLSALMESANMEAMGLDDLISSIRKAKANDDIKGIYLEGGIAEFDSPATAQQLRDALKDFKKSGKWIVAYADQYLQGCYYVASVADNIYLNAEGMIDFKGLGRKTEYYKGLFDLLGIRYQAAKVGKYKSYVEQNTMTGMSDYDREQRTAYINGIWQYWLKEMAEGRKVKPEQLNQLANDSILMLADTKDYLRARLIDKVMYPEEVKADIKRRLKIGQDDEIAQLTLTDMLSVKTKEKQEGAQIAVYYAYGSIIDEEVVDLLGSEHSIVGKTTAEDLRRLADDDDVKAVVLRVNSGGGSAVASEQIRHAVQIVKARKPIVVSMGGAAASGGYWISSPASCIVAEPTTITGSIGIFGLIPNFSGLVQDKLGVTFDGVKTNKYTDYLENLVLEKDNSEEMKYMQHHVDRGYQAFLDIVSEGRGMKPAEVDSIAQGRVWLGTDALKLRLIDQLGSLDDAVRKAAQLAKLSEYHTAPYPAKGSWMDQLMPKERKGTYLDGQLKLLLGDLYEPLKSIYCELGGNNSHIQARLLDDIRVK